VTLSTWTYPKPLTKCHIIAYVINWNQQKNSMQLSYQQIVLNGSTSNLHLVCPKVPSLLPFYSYVMHINDLPLFVNSKVGLYANDTILYSVVHSLSGCTHLLDNLNSLIHWTTMNFNPEKCVYMRITCKQNPVLYKYTLNGIFIKEVSSTKYLGVTITSGLSWSNHINSIISKVHQVKAFLQRYLKRCPSHLKLKCLNTMVCPLIE